LPAVQVISCGDQECGGSIGADAIARAKGREQCFHRGRDAPLPVGDIGGKVWMRRARRRRVCTTAAATFGGSLLFHRR
jgi:hypothetical protein